MVAANWLIFQHRWVWKGIFQLSGGITLILLAVIAFTDGKQALNDWADNLRFIAVGVIFNILLLFLSCGVAIPLHVRKQFRGLNLEGHIVEFQYGDEGVRMIDKNNDTRVSWLEFKRWHENKSLLLLCRTDWLFHYVPKHQVDDRHIAALKSALLNASVPLQ